MIDLSTKYMGLLFKNPLVVASCGLTRTVKGVESCHESGAGGIVLKSLFEEEISHEKEILKDQLATYAHTESYNYLDKMGMGVGARDYLQLIKDAKSAVPVPVIASLNCVSTEWWIDYAQQIEDAGADALELNISIMPVDLESESEKLEIVYFTIVEELKKRVTIPIAVKLGPYFTSFARVANELCVRGVAGLVLFNRFYQPDIDINKFELVPAYNFSSPEDMGVSLRWIALLSGNVSCDFAASTGVHDGAGAIKQILAGASVVQLCSTLYIHKLSQIEVIKMEIETWMEKHGYCSISEFRGKMSQLLSEKPEEYERVQYIKALTGIG